MPTKASLLKNKMRARGIKVAGETPSPRNMKTYDEIGEQVTSTSHDFKTGTNKPPAAPTLPPPSAAKPAAVKKNQPHKPNPWGFRLDNGVFRVEDAELDGVQLQEKPGDGYLGPTPIPNPIRLAKDAVDATNRASQKKVNAVNSVLPGSASMPKHTYFNKGPSAASQRYLGLSNSFEPEGEVLDERRKEDKVAGTPRKPRNKAFEIVAKSMGAGRMGVQPRGQKKVPGKKPPVAGEYGAPKSPAQKVAMVRAARKRSQDNMSSRYD